MEADLYAVLQLSPSASVADIRSAFKAHALRCHPDKVPEGEREAATVRFATINQAYTVLSDAHARSAYDATLAANVSAAAAAAAAAAQQQQHTIIVHQQSLHPMFFQVFTTTHSVNMGHTFHFQFP